MKNIFYRFFYFQFCSIILFHKFCLCKLPHHIIGKNTMNLLKLVKNNEYDLDISESLPLEQKLLSP